MSKIKISNKELVGDAAVSIKPVTYKTKRALAEEIKVKIIFYEKKKSGLEIDASDFFRQQ